MKYKVLFPHEMTWRKRNGMALKLECDANLRSQYHVFETCHEAETQVKLSQWYNDKPVQHADEVTKIQRDCRAKRKKLFIFCPVYINMKDLVLLPCEHTLWDISLKQRLTCTVFTEWQNKLTFQLKCILGYFYCCSGAVFSQEGNVHFLVTANSVFFLWQISMLPSPQER